MARSAGVRRRKPAETGPRRHRASRGCGRAIDENSKLQAVCPRLHGDKKQTRRASSTNASWGNTAPVSHQWNTGRTGVDEDFAGFRERNRVKSRLLLMLLLSINKNRLAKSMQRQKYHLDIKHRASDIAAYRLLPRVML